MATHLLRLHKTNLSYPHAPSPHPVHVWVIGNDKWLAAGASDSKLLQRIHEDEQDPHYRIVIVGAGWPEHAPYAGNAVSWLRQAGMIKKKRHANTKSFHEHGELLLDLMFEHYREMRCPPSAVLDHFGLPYAFCGDQSSKREERLLDRIQQ